MLDINSDNRDEVQARYVDYLISRMDFMQVREILKDYINTDTIFYSHDDLRDEIISKGPDAIREVFGSCGSKNLLHTEVLL